jgi:biotin carboxyl carrier protein
MTYEVTIGGKVIQVEVQEQAGLWRCRISTPASATPALAGGPQEREWIVDLAQPEREKLSLLIGGESYEVWRDHTAQGLQIWVRGSRFAAEVRDPRSLRARRAAGHAGEGPQKLVASMPGKVVRVLCSANEAVEPGQGILVIEAMKMQNELKSPKKGIVRQMLAKEGAAVNAGDVLAIVE